MLYFGDVLELVDKKVSKTFGRKLVWVRFPPSPHMEGIDKNILAFLIGVAIGDGNLSNPNSRAVRLRVTCDIKYKNILQRIINSIKALLPDNKVSIIKRKDNCIDVSCYSNKWTDLLGWQVGSKYDQKIRIPDWIKADNGYIKHCLKGLFETDGSVYKDREYLMANFTTIIPSIAEDVCSIIAKIGFQPNSQKILQKSGKYKYVIRVAKRAEDVVKYVEIYKN